jgi:CubicO group peptidase (beta-lactamase class C family)
LLALGALWGLVVDPYLRIAAGYCATIAAAAHFGTGDSLATLREQRFPARVGFVFLQVDEDARAVRARALYVTSRAVFREGLGATREETRRVELPPALPEPVPALPADLPWPLGCAPGVEAFPQEIEAERLEGVLAAACAPGRGTQALLLAHRGRLLFERYAQGYGPATPLLGWSMTKSATATLVGRLVQEGLLDVEAPARLPEWQDDERRDITLDDLLRMRSGLEFYQDHASPFCDSLNMLFVAGDCAAFARGRSLAHPIGGVWSYSDGTSNILAGLVLDAVSDSLYERLRAPRELLFAPLGMRTAFISVDGAGNFVGSSLMYASARDWARLGQLYLQDGLWNGLRLLPAGWADYVSRPTENSDGRRYGAHFWRSDAGPCAGVFWAQGYQGQYLFIDRSRAVVLVRLGLAPLPFDGEALAHEVLAAFSSAG